MKISGTEASKITHILSTLLKAQWPGLQDVGESVDFLTATFFGIFSPPFPH